MSSWDPASENFDIVRGPRGVGAEFGVDSFAGASGLRE